MIFPLATPRKQMYGFGNSYNTILIYEVFQGTTRKS